MLVSSATRRTCVDSDFTSKKSSERVKKPKLRVREETRAWGGQAGSRIIEAMGFQKHRPPPKYVLPTIAGSEELGF